MMILHGMYSSKEMGDDHSFCFWAESAGRRHPLPDEAAGWAGDLTIRNEQHRHWVPRVNMAETLLALAGLRRHFSPEMAYWLQLMQWIKDQAARGTFFPGLVQTQNRVYYAKWLPDLSDWNWRSGLEEWVKAGEAFLNRGEETRDWVYAFTEDGLDSFVRFCINTRISLNHSHLGKLLKFKPFYLHEEWFHRLCMEEHLAAEGKRWEELFADFQKWIGMGAEDTGAGNLCFRLEPADAEHEWKIRYFWRDSSGRLIPWDELEQDAQKERFVRSLVDAAEVFSPFAGQWAYAPDFCPVTMEQAYRFLLCDMLEEMQSKGDRVLIFTQFAKMGHLLQRELQKRFEQEIPFLYGGVAKAKRDEIIERFQSEEQGWPILLLSLKAGGVGLNLTRANRVIQRNITPDLVAGYPLCLGFFIPKMDMSCTCGEVHVPCKHLIASALAAAERWAEDHPSYLRWVGIPWEEILLSFGQRGQVADPGLPAEEFAQVPFPGKHNAGQGRTVKTTPPFWSSPFPFPLIMREIYEKVAEDPAEK